MIVVIQCAASKAYGAGHLLTPAGVPVTFVAHPEIAPVDDEHLHARPDDDCGSGKSWRDVLLDYNNALLGNPLGLLPAYRLYENPVYERLVDKLGIANVYILSAGWGLIRSDFLTPYYDVTFSASARGNDAYKRRHKADRYRDFRMLADETEHEILFLGGKAYIPLFCKLTGSVKSKRTVFYSSAQPPDAPGCVLPKFETTTRTNWQYECANAFLRDGLCSQEAGQEVT
jgi:hypothetical protein